MKFKEKVREMAARRGEKKKRKKKGGVGGAHTIRKGRRKDSYLITWMRT